MQTITDSTTSTPQAMIPASATQATTGLGVESFTSDNILAVVTSCAVSKDGNGYSFQKGNGLFNASCQAVKSKLGWSKESRLPEHLASAIRNAVNSLIAACQQQVNSENISTCRKSHVLCGNRVTEKVQLTGYNPKSLTDQKFIAKLRINELRSKLEKASLEGKDTTTLERQLQRWTDARKLATFDLEQHAKSVTDAIRQNKSAEVAKQEEQQLNG